MTTKQGIIAAIQAKADATDNNQTRIAYGAPGASLPNIIGKLQPTGIAWDESEFLKAWPLVIEGLADYLNKVRRVTTPTDLTGIDRTIEVAANGVAVTLPAPDPVVAGQYVIKPLNVTGATIVGTLDGAPGPLALVAWEAVRVYCNGAEWFTW